MGLFSSGRSARRRARRQMRKQKDYYTGAMERQASFYQGEIASLHSSYQSNMASLQASANQQAQEMQAEAEAALAKQRADFQRESARLAKKRKTAQFAMQNRQAKMVKQAKAKGVRESIQDTGERLGGGAGSRIARVAKPRRRVAGSRRRGRGGGRPA